MENIYYKSNEVSNLRKYISDIVKDNIEYFSLESSRCSLPINSTLYRHKNYELEEFEIDTMELSKAYHKPVGSYSLLTIKDPMDIDNRLVNEYIKDISVLLAKFIGEIKKSSKYLIVGLGNQEIQADSLGNLVCKNVLVTRHLKKEPAFKDTPSISAITPSVMGLTGIESSDIINSIVKEIRPDCIIVIDSLCASSIARLGKSIQITNAGIFPGAGINNKRKPLNKEILGCKVVAIGVPLMIYASSFANNNEIDENLIVTFNNINEVVNILSEIIYKAINLTFLGFKNL